MNKQNAQSALSAEFLLQHSSAVSYVCRAEGDFGATFVTDNVYEQLGYHPSDFVENPGFWAAHIHPEDRERVFAAVSKLFEHGKHVHEYRFLDANGRYRWMRDELRLIRNEVGEPKEMIGYWIDITDRVEAEQLLKRRELTLEAALNDSTDAIVTASEQGVIQWFNPAAEKLFGYSTSEVLGSDVGILVPENLRDKHGGSIQRYRQTKNRYILGAGPQETIARRKDGSLIPIEISLSESTGGGKTTYITIIRDITKRKRHEEEQLLLQRQLQNVRRMESIGHIAGGVAHEFNNVLAIILGHAELGLARLAPAGNDKLEKYFAQIRAAAERGRDVVLQLLAYTQGTNSEKNERLDLAEVMDDLGGVLRAVLPATIELCIKVDSKVPLINGNRAEIQRLLLDLCSNARDAMGEKGSITITIGSVNVQDKECSSCGSTVEGNFVEMAVIDTGHGLDTDEISRIFEPFYSNKAPGNGTGMGMSVLHGVVHSGGGHIIIESEKGNGTAVKILFSPLS